MSFSLFTDGGSRGNPGPSAIGIVLKNKNGEVIYEASKYIGKYTNNDAEYLALIQGLIIANEKKIKSIASYLDSELLVKQLNGEYKVKNERLQKLFTKVRNLENKFTKVSFTHVRREKNKRADELVNEALDSNGF